MTSASLRPQLSLPPVYSLEALGSTPRPALETTSPCGKAPLRQGELAPSLSAIVP
nr:hypothetical protein [uncultured Porphyromonas sp.]